MQPRIDQQTVDQLDNWLSKPVSRDAVDSTARMIRRP
jgi:hypothetical protein